LPADRPPWRYLRGHDGRYRDPAPSARRHVPPRPSPADRPPAGKDAVVRLSELRFV